MAGEHACGFWWQSMKTFEQHQHDHMTDIEDDAGTFGDFLEIPLNNAECLELFQTMLKTYMVDSRNHPKQDNARLMAALAVPTIALLGKMAEMAWERATNYAEGQDCATDEWDGVPLVAGRHR